MSHPALANTHDGSLHWIHPSCAKRLWNLQGYQTLTSGEASPCCGCGEATRSGALVGHAPAGMPCHEDPTHPAYHRRAP
jgi:hypothetical protein